MTKYSIDYKIEIVSKYLFQQTYFEYSIDHTEIRELSKLTQEHDLAALEGANLCSLTQVKCDTPLS